MNIQIERLVPAPLQDRFLNRLSDIWNSEQLFLHGQKVKIKAASGTGKTTFVHILYGLRHDYIGNVFWNDTNLRLIKENELAKARQQQVSIIFQYLRLFANLTARENIELNRVLTTPLYGADAIDAMSEQLGIQHILEQQAGTCSYGEQQRVAIIRALVQPFQWLIMDEPFSHLDHQNIKKAALLIQEECEKRKAGFIITDLEDDDHLTYTHQYQL